MFMFMYYIK